MTDEEEEAASTIVGGAVPTKDAVVRKDRIASTMFKFAFLDACDDDIVGLKKIGEFSPSVRIADAVDVELEYGGRRCEWRAGVRMNVAAEEEEEEYETSS